MDFHKHNSNSKFLLGVVYCHPSATSVKEFIDDFNNTFLKINSKNINSVQWRTESILGGMLLYNRTAACSHLLNKCVEAGVAFGAGETGDRLGSANLGARTLAKYAQYELQLNRIYINEKNCTDCCCKL